MRPSPDELQSEVRYVWDIRWAAVGKIMVGLFALGIAGSVLSQVRDVAVWVGAAFFLAIALNPLVARLEPRLGRTVAVLTVFLGFVVGLLVVVTALVAPFVTQ